MTVRKPRGRPPKRKTLENAGQLSLFESMSPDAKEAIKTMLRVRRSNSNSWRGLMATPPGSLLETVIGAFRQGTDIPLEIPFFTTLHYLSAYLLKQEVKIEFVGQEFQPDLWSVILAPSGAGKTFTTNMTGRFIGYDSSFPEPASAAKFVEDLKEHNRSLWIRDEFGKFLKALEAQHMAEIKDYLLRVYDGKRIERNTKKYSLAVDNPALTILGLTVLDAFAKEIDATSMIDGFAQRFSYVIADRDPERKPQDFPIYDLQGWEGMIRNEWERVIASVKHQRYVVGEDAQEGFKQSFRLLMPQDDVLDTSFFRRIMIRGVRYALLYHVLLKKESHVVDVQDMGWAARVCAMHIQDAARIVADHAMPDVERIIRRAEEVRDRVWERENRAVTARDIVRGVHGIKNTAEARAIMQFIAPGANA